MEISLLLMELAEQRGTEEKEGLEFIGLNLLMEMSFHKQSEIIFILRTPAITPCSSS